MSNEETNTAVAASPAEDAPEIAGEVPQDPNIIGTLNPDEIATLTNFRQRNAQIVNEIGNIEVRKARLLGSLSEIEDRANALLQSVGQRLGLSDGEPFQMLPDGRVRKVPAPSAGTV